MFIESLVSIFLLIGLSKACEDLAADSEGFRRGFQDSIGKSRSKALGSGGGSVPEKPPSVQALLTNKPLPELKWSASSPSEMDDSVELRFSVDGKSTRQGPPKVSFKNQEKGSEASLIVSRSWLNAAGPEKTSSSNWKNPTQGQKPNLSPGSDNYATNIEGRLHPHTHGPENVELNEARLSTLVVDFWKPKAVKVSAEVNELNQSPIGLIEVGGQPVNTEDLKLRYPEEGDVIIDKRKLKVPFTFLHKSNAEYFESTHRKLSKLIGFHYEKQYRGRVDEKTYAYIRNCDILDEGIMEGKKELKRLGLPNSLSKEPVSQVASILVKQRQLSVTPLTQVKELDSTIKKELWYEEASPMGPGKSTTKRSCFQLTGKPSLKRHHSGSPDSSNQPKLRKSGPIMKKQPEKGDFKDGQLKPENTLAQKTRVQTLETGKMVANLAVNQFRVTRAMLAYCFPAVIHDIRVLCEAFPQVKEITGKTARELQWDAWNFYHVIMNNISLLFSQGGSKIWGAHSSMPHNKFKELINKIESMELEYWATERAIVISRKFLGLWMSCHCKKLYVKTHSSNSLSNRFIGALNEFYKKNSKLNSSL